MTPAYYEKRWPRAQQSATQCLLPSGLYTPEYNTHVSYDRLSAAPLPPAPIMHHQSDERNLPKPYANGVLEVLDYDLTLMADFCSQLIRNLAGQGGQISDTHGQMHAHFVNTLLRATRLPRNTILLATVYFAQHMWSCAPRQPLSPSELWQQTLMCLVMANKFWDDSTFTNKSWADISGMDLRDINAAEIEWLHSQTWSLSLSDVAIRRWNSHHSQYVKRVTCSATAVASNYRRFSPLTVQPTPTQYTSRRDLQEPHAVAARHPTTPHAPLPISSYGYLTPPDSSEIRQHAQFSNDPLQQRYQPHHQALQQHQQPFGTDYFWSKMSNIQKDFGPKFCTFTASQTFY